MQTKITVRNAEEKEIEGLFFEFYINVEGNGEEN
jgi:hypothetical protein